jgi:hypothetical protein
LFAHVQIIITVFTSDNLGRFVIGGGFSAADAEPTRLIDHIRTSAGVPDLGVCNLNVAWAGAAPHVVSGPPRRRPTAWRWFDRFCARRAVCRVK